MKRPARFLALATVAMIATAAQGQIKVNPTYAPHEPIVAEYSPTIPPGAQVQTTWTVTKPAALIQLTPTSAAIWAPPGTYDLTINGLWVLTHETTVDGKPAQILERFALVSAAAAFKVTAPTPPKPPTPPPPPPPAPVKPTKVTAAIIEETTTRTPEQAALFLSPALDQWAAKGGHKLYLFDKDQDTDKTSFKCEGRNCVPVKVAAVSPQFRPLIAAARGKPIPQVVIADQQTGRIIATADAPATVETLLQLLKKHAGEP
jgi:hypothetical protein